MKKIIGFFVAVMLVVSMLTVSAFAAGSTAVYGTNVTAEAGDTVTIAFKINGNTGFDATKMTVSAAAPLEITNITKGLMNGGLINLAKGIINHASETAVTADGTLFTVTVKVAANAAAGTYPVNLKVAYLTETDVSLNYTVAGGSVTIEAEETVPPTTEAPTQKPTEAPTEAPTQKPTEAPTEAPTQKPTEAPTTEPTEGPTTEPVKPGDDDVPQTGDMVGMIVFGTVAMISVVAGAAYVCKRKFAK